MDAGRRGGGRGRGPGAERGLHEPARRHPRLRQLLVHVVPLLRLLPPRGRHPLAPQGGPGPSESIAVRVHRPSPLPSESIVCLRSVRVERHPLALGRVRPSRAPRLPRPYRPSPSPRVPSLPVPQPAQDDPGSSESCPASAPGPDSRAVGRASDRGAPCRWLACVSRGRRLSPPQSARLTRLESRRRAARRGRSSCTSCRAAGTSRPWSRRSSAAPPSPGPRRSSTRLRGRTPTPATTPASSPASA